MKHSSFINSLLVFSTACESMMRDIVQAEVEAVLYVIPRKECTVKEFVESCNTSISKNYIKSLNKQFKDLDILIDDTLVEFKDDDVLACICIESNGYCWQDKGMPAYIANDTFPNVLPLRLLKGHKEGDIIHLSIMNHKVILFCGQCLSRNKEYKTFEEALEVIG